MAIITNIYKVIFNFYKTISELVLLGLVQLLDYGAKFISSFEEWTLGGFSNSHFFQVLVASFKYCLVGISRNCFNEVFLLKWLQDFYLFLHIGGLGWVLGFIIELSKEGLHLFDKFLFISFGFFLSFCLEMSNWLGEWDLNTGLSDDVTLLVRAWSVCWIFGELINRWVITEEGLDLFVNLVEVVGDLLLKLSLSLEVGEVLG